MSGSSSASGASATGGASGSSSASGSNGSGGQSGSSAGATQAGTSSSPLLMQMPDCEANQQNIGGTFRDAAVTKTGSTSTTTLEPRAYYTVEVTPRSRLRLEWANDLQANVVQPLTGGYFLTTWDTANRDVLYCAVAGEIGALPLEANRPDDDYFKFHITRAQAGEVGMTAFSESAKCDGEEFDVDLRGCVYRYAN